MALAEVNRALVLEPDSADAHAVRADLQFFYDWDWAGAERSYQRAIGLNGSFARARSQYARLLSAVGRHQEAVLEATQAADLDPTSASAASTQALAHYYARNYTAAMESVEHALRLEPSAASPYIVLSRIDVARGALDEAVMAGERALALAGDKGSTAWRVHVIRQHALLGERDTAHGKLAKISADIASGQQRVGKMQLAYAHLALGEREQALQLLERALDEREPDLLWLAVDPRADELRSERRFQQVVGRLGIPR
jgi:serine/threonine-protein kinase